MINKGSYDAAAKEYEEVDINHPYSQEARKAIVMAAYAYYKAGKFDDAVSAAGEYLGGAIAPGVGISLDALVAHTAKLIRVELLAPDAVIGRSTMSAIQSGLLWGFVGQIEYMVRRMTDELGGTAHVIATGGQAGMVAGLTHVINDVDPQLTLEGLRLIHLQNTSDGGT
jgi:type III pantothenate kinase